MVREQIFALSLIDTNWSVWQHANWSVAMAYSYNTTTVTTAAMQCTRAPTAYTHQGRSQDLEKGGVSRVSYMRAKKYWGDHAPIISRDRG